MMGTDESNWVQRPRQPTKGRERARAGKSGLSSDEQEMLRVHTSEGSPIRLLNSQPHDIIAFVLVDLGPPPPFDSRCSIGAPAITIIHLAKNRSTRTPLIVFVRPDQQEPRAGGPFLCKPSCTLVLLLCSLSFNSSNSTSLLSILLRSLDRQTISTTVHHGSPKRTSCPRRFGRYGSLTLGHLAACSACRTSFAGHLLSH